MDTYGIPSRHRTLWTTMDQLFVVKSAPAPWMPWCGGRDQRLSKNVLHHKRQQPLAEAAPLAQGVPFRWAGRRRIDDFFGGKENMVFKLVLRTRETKKLERCHVNTFVKQVFEQSCAFYQFSPVTVPVHCRQWNVEGVEVQSLECEESGLLSGECRV